MSTYASIPANVQIKVECIRFQPQTCLFTMSFIDEEFPGGSLIPLRPGEFNWAMPDQGGFLEILQGNKAIRQRDKAWHFGVGSAAVNYPPQVDAPIIIAADPADRLVDLRVFQQGQGPLGTNSMLRITW